MTTTTQQSLLNKAGMLSVERNQLSISVIIRDARSSYGRNEVLVVPEHGSGEAWVTLDRIELK
jgi:hypothetical protein